MGDDGVAAGDLACVFGDDGIGEHFRGSALGKRRVNCV